MNKYIYLYIYIYIHTQILHISISTRAYEYIHTYIDLYICVYICVYVYTYVHVRVPGATDATSVALVQQRQRIDSYVKYTFGFICARTCSRCNRCN